MLSILVVDDDPLICKGLKFNLEKAGYSVTTATNSRVAVDQARRQQFKAAILDIGLPGEDGFSLCHYLKSNYPFPIIFLTARRRELDEIVGFEIGADDYITKPFSMDVLLVRLKAILRRGLIPETGGTQEKLGPVETGSFYINHTTHTAKRNGQTIELAPKEFDLLTFFLYNPQSVFNVDEIIEQVWGVEYLGEPQVLYVQIRGLREKIEDDPSRPQHLLTLRGVGYKFLP
jgi:DNA-binding response OmpR family regulator